MKTTSTQYVRAFDEDASRLDRLFFPLVAIAIATSLVMALFT